MSTGMILLFVATLAGCAYSSQYDFAPWTPRWDDGLQVPNLKGPLGPWVQRRGPPPFVRIVRSVPEDISPAVEEIYENESDDERHKRAVEQTLSQNELIGEIIDEKDIPKGAEVIELSENSDFEEITEDKSPVSRSKRAPRITIIRIVNRRTGKVTILVIRRR